MSRPVHRGVGLAGAGLAVALLASCGERARPVAQAPAPAAPAATSTAQVAPTRSPDIPSVFRGEWNMRLEDCGSALNDSRLVIAARTVEFHESSGDVASAAVQGDTLTVRAMMSGEGETWEETYRFRLSPDGRALRQPVSQDDEGVRRLRCPAITPR